MVLNTRDLFDLSHSLAGQWLTRFPSPFHALLYLKDFISGLYSELEKSGEYFLYGNGICLHKSAVIAPSAHIGGYTVIGANTEIRHCAFIRGCAVIGDGCVIGNSCEIKNSVLFDGVQAPHFNYVGDSVLGYKAHMGAGAVTSNVKSDRSPISSYGAQFKKAGALLGDFAEIGCNCVLNPATVIGRHSNVYPTCSVRGTVPSDSIYKNADCIVKRIK